MKFPLLVFVLIGSLLKIQAQKDSIIQTLEPVIIKSYKFETIKEKLPASITAKDFTQSQNSRQQLSFNDYLIDVPGLFALNATNYSQDLRVSIRGFGARSSFGIRGVKIMVDGIPETTPDGQGQIDNLNLGAIKNLEVIRGSSSVLYGNASGGVISINTLDTVDENYVNFGITGGNYGMQQYQFSTGLKTEKTNFLLQVNHVKTNGYRDFSGFKNTNFNGRIFHSFSNRSKLNLVLNYSDSPYAQDAGSLNEDSVKEDRRQARQRNVDFDTEESIKQFKIGANYNYKFSQLTKFNTYAFFATRDFYGKLPFEFGGVIDLDRNYFGHGSNIDFHTKKKNLFNKIQLGYELAFQNDLRQRFRNLEGEQGDKTLDQNEIFNNFGVYVLDQLEIKNWLLSTGLRYDSNVLKAEDNFLDNGDDSGIINLNAFNVSFGANYKLKDYHYIFGNISTSFETPVLNELSSNPFTDGGFNEDLEAQKATNYEIGYKLKNKNTQAELVFFYIKTKNDIVPLELEDGGDFFRNAGISERKGVELSITNKFTEQFKINASYTYSDFRYEDYTTSNGVFDGKALPAIPKHRVSLNSTYNTNKGLFIQLQGSHVGSLYVNDSNSVKDDAYTVLNLRLKQSIKFEKFALVPFIGVNNILDQTYNDNIRINAFGGRYFEPAAGSNVYGGVRLLL
ncbi:TonB-dependent receptor family protein [Winogradskyella sp. R77965]|uniref:TonB-dependent receptor family protein n=1 Tax=Winogradskyella sp. R77965 TaxID=3093872 RepID=UPI0037DCAFD0